MPITAKLRYLRIAPRKVRLVADLIRRKSAEEAKNILNFTTKKAASVILKLLKSAVANGKNNFQLEEGNLYIQKILVDEGPRFKRWFPRARGKADEIQKKTSHITIILEEIVKKSKETKEIKEIGKTEKAKRVKGISKLKRAKFRPGAELPKPKEERGTKRVFRRKAF